MDTKTQRDDAAQARAAQLSAESAPDADTGVHGARLALIFVGLLLAMFVSSLSETIESTALPTIVGDLGGVEIMQWVSTSYILASTITMPIYGKLGDMLGRKYLLITSLGIYAAGKVVCGITPNMAILLLGRVISGLGGGGLIILSQSIIADVVSPRQRGKYLGVMGAVFACSMVLGPLLGGWFVQTVGWRMIFDFEIPLAVLAMVACAFCLPKPQKVTNRLKLDIWGMIFMAISVVCFVLATSWGGTTYPWLSWQILGLLAGLLVFGTAFVFIEKRAQAPVIPMLLFKNRNFVLCTVSGMLIYLGFMGTLTYMPTYLQIVRGLTPTAAGLMMTPMMAGALLTSTTTGFIATRTGKYKWMPIAMCLVAGVAFFLLSTITPSMPTIQLLAYFFILGFGLGLGQQILVLIVQNEFPHAIVGTATAGNNFFRQIGSTLGASVVGALFTSRLTADLAKMLPHVDNISISTITPSAVDKLPEVARHAIATGYSDALVPLFIYFVPLMVVGAILMCLIVEHPLAKSINHTGHASDTM